MNAIEAAALSKQRKNDIIRIMSKIEEAAMSGLYHIELKDGEYGLSPETISFFITLGYKVYEMPKRLTWEHLGPEGAY